MKEQPKSSLNVPIKPVQSWLHKAQTQNYDKKGSPANEYEEKNASMQDASLKPVSVQATDKTANNDFASLIHEEIKSKTQKSASTSG